MTSPITPPPELVEQWYEASVLEGRITYDEYNFANLAARWGADQELEATLGLMATLNIRGVDYVRNARRPKPRSLKERALQAWAAVEAGTDDQTAMAVIRRALEALDD